MRDLKKIIIAYPNSQAAFKIKRVLAENQFTVAGIYQTGVEALNIANKMGEGVVICSYKLPDMLAVNLADMLPQNFDLIILLASGQMYSSYASNIITLNLPLNRLDFVNTVSMLAQTESASWIEKKHPKTERSDEDKKLIQKAKEILIYRNNMSENDAHKLLQKRSMDTGIKIVDIAKMVIEGNNNYNF